MDSSVWVGLFLGYPAIPGAFSQLNPQDEALSAKAVFKDPLSTNIPDFPSYPRQNMATPASNIGSK